MTIEEAISFAASMREAAQLIDMDYQTFRKRAKELGVWKPNQGRAGFQDLQNWNRKRPHQVLILRKPGSRRQTPGVVRRCLIEIGREYRCEECGTGPTWNNKRLHLPVDHRNGHNYDDRPENLRFLCPNCHSQTPTFAGRNVRQRGGSGRHVTLRT